MMKDIKSRIINFLLIDIKYSSQIELKKNMMVLTIA